MQQKQERRYQFVLTACARWEDEEIVEWIEFHKAIGIEHIYLYCNDDHYRPLFKRVLPYVTGPTPFLTFIFWESLGDQLGMYADYLRNYKDETEWCCFLDIDEFLVLKGQDNVKEFMARFNDDVSCVYFNWILYGNCGKTERDGDFVLSSLFKRSGRIDVHTKAFFRTAAVSASSALDGAHRTGLAFTHFWNDYYPDGQFQIRNVLGENMADYTKDFPKHAGNFVSDEARAARIRDTGYVAHFQFKSERDFIRRVERGGFAQQEIWKALYERGDAATYLTMINEMEDQYLALLWNRILDACIRIGP